MEKIIKVLGHKVIYTAREYTYKYRDYMGDECEDSNTARTYKIAGRKKIFDSEASLKEWIKKNLKETA